MGIIRAKRSEVHLFLTAAILVLGVHSLRLWASTTRIFDPDEFEHLHVAWLIAKGFLPYRDFFEHHTPALYYLLAPCFAFVKAETGYSHAYAAIVFARWLMWLLAGLVLVLTLWLGRCWRGWRVGLLAAVLLALTMIFIRKTTDVRPDVLALVFWMGCLVCLVRAVQWPEPRARRAKALFFGSGLLLGLALMATQKMLFAGPGLALVMAWYLFDRRARGTFGLRCRNALWQLGGLLVPVVLTLGYFALRGGLDEFVEYNLLLNMAWKHRFTPYIYILGLVLQNVAVVGFGLAGLGRACCGMFRTAALRRGDFVLAINTLALLAGLFIIPVPQRQYFLVFLPLLALFAATAIVGIVDFLEALRARGSTRRRLSLIVDAAGMIGIITAVGLWWAHVSVNLWVDLLAEVLVDLSGIMLAAFLCCFGFRNHALVLLTLVLSLYPVSRLRLIALPKNTAQLERIRYVLEHSAPQDTVMDGWEGVGVFRPHAWYYWMLHWEIRVMLDEPQKQQLLEDLHSGRIAPAMVNLDPSLEELSPEITEFFTRRYASVGIGYLRAPRKARHVTAPTTESPPPLAPVTSHHE